MKNHYEILGVPRDADEETIKAAYRDLAKKLHPDQTGGNKRAEGRLKDITAAYNVLKHADKRIAYDANLKREQQTKKTRPKPASTTDGRQKSGDRFREAAADIFGTGRRDDTQRHNQNIDAEASVHITAGLARGGGDLELEADIQERCGACAGSGGRREVICADCGGTGRSVRKDGIVTREWSCQHCAGKGTFVTCCASCGGEGVRTNRRRFRAKIAAGTADGTILRFRDRGNIGLDGRRGDLYVTLKVLADNTYNIDGTDASRRLQIGIVTATLGGQVEFDGVDGERLRVSVPPGTQSGTRFRIVGRGLPNREGGRGDLTITIEIQIPTAVTPQQAELLRQFETASTN